MDGTRSRARLTHGAEPRGTKHRVCAQWWLYMLSDAEGPRSDQRVTAPHGFRGQKPGRLRADAIAHP